MLLIVLGMVFLSTLAFNYLEKLILWTTLMTCCRRDRRLYTLIKRNMEGHRPRNNKTAIIFTLATSYVIWAQSGFEVVTSMFKNLTY